ncbi:hypothetical protein D3C87_1194430 [compost metagenome]
MFVQHPQVELHDVPANDRVGVMLGEPFVELFQQQRSRFAVFELEIHLAVVAVGRAEHVHLALAAAFQGDGIQVALSGGFDVQRHQFQARSVIGIGFHLCIEHQAIGPRRPAKTHRCGDEALHHVALRRAHVSFVHLDAGPAQRGFQAHQLPVLAAIQTEYRAMFEIQQGQGFELDVFLVV